MPTDCPQRDERLSWTGDAQIFARTGALNFDIDAFMRKFISDIDTARNSTTGAIYDIAPKGIRSAKATAAGATRA